MDNNSFFKESCSALDRLIEKSKAQTSTKMKSAVIALFTGDDENPLRYSGQIGMLHLDNDRILKSKFLRIYDIDTLTLVLQVQLYYGFSQNYKAICETIYAFDYLDKGIIALQFFSKSDAQMMSSKIASVSPKMEEFRQIQKQLISSQIKQKHESGLFGSVKKKMKKIFHHQEQSISQESKVMSVQKKKSIRFDNSTGAFNTENLPPEWEQIFDAMHLNTEDLKDTDLAKFIMEETLIHQSRKHFIQNPSEQLKVCLDTIDEEVSTTNDESEEKPELPVVGNLPKPPPLHNLPVPPALNNLPVPPPLLTPPQLSQNTGVRSSVRGRADLMTEIRNNNLRLKPVKTTEKGYEIDASSMNKQERLDLAEHLRLKLQKRKAVLNRRKASGDSQSD